MLLLQIVVAILCLAAALLQFAAHRSPDVSDSESGQIARKVIIVGLLVGALYILYMVFEFGSAAVPFCLALGLVSFGLCMQASDAIWKHIIDFQQHVRHGHHEHHHT